MGAANTIQPTQTESKFELEELFFSTTDTHGKITAGNDVFTRVSHYSWEELYLKPHSIIRHPDMPRAVFQVLWDTIEAGKPIAAYVKNMSKDGAYYWVLALVCPIPGGYLSVRLKPSTPLLATVEKLYDEVRKAERLKEAVDGSKTLAATEGVSMILTALNQLGFKNYDAFSEHILVTELKSRDSALGRGATEPEDATAEFSASAILNLTQQLNGGLNAVFGDIASFFALSQRLQKSSGYILELASEVGLLSLNATVEATRLQDTGRTLGIIAQHIGEAAISIKRTVESVHQTMSELDALLKRTAFELGSCKLYVEMAQFFIQSLKTGAGSTGDNERNIKLLLDVIGKSLERTHATAHSFGRLLYKFQGQAEDLVKFILGLRFIHVSGKVEVSRLTNATAFEAIFEKAIDQVHAARDELVAINQLASEVRLPTDSLARMIGVLEEAAL